MKKHFFSSFIVIVLLFGCQQTTEKKIKIGSIQQLSVQMAKYGKTHVAAVRAMLDLINEERKSKSLPQIELIVDDDQLKPAVGVNIIQKFIDIDGVVAVIGAQGSSVTLAIAPIAEEKEVVLISGASGSPQISDAGDYIFRTCPSDIYEGRTMGEYYEKRFKGEPLAIIYINNDYGIGLRDAFLNALSDRPSKVLDLAYAQGAVDFRNQLTKIKQDNIKVVYLVGYNEMVSIYKQAKELGLTCQWLGNNQLNDQSLIDKMGTTADGTIFPGHDFELDKIKVSYPRFYYRYLKLSNGVELDVFAAYGVDAFIVINYALMQGAQTGTEIKDILYETTSFEGLIGNFSFDENGDALRNLGLYEIKNSKIVKYLVSPDK